MVTPSSSSTDCSCAQCSAILSWARGLVLLYLRLPAVSEPVQTVPGAGLAWFQVTLSDHRTSFSSFPARSLGNFQSL